MGQAGAREKLDKGLASDGSRTWMRHGMRWSSDWSWPAAGGMGGLGRGKTGGLVKGMGGLMRGNR